MHPLSRAPGPRGHFFLGSLPEYRRDPLGFLSDMARYGDVVSYRLGPRRLVLLNHPDLIEQVLVTDHRSFGKNFVIRWTRALLGNGLLTSEGDLWLRQRRLAQPAFARDRIAGYAATMTSYATRWADVWQDGEVRDAHTDMMSLTLQIAAKTLLDVDVADSTADVGGALEDFQTSFEGWFSSALPLPLWVPTPGNLRLSGAIRRLDNLIYPIIAERRASGEDRGDFLSMLLGARDDDGSQMTDRQLRDEALTILLAGHETTALALAWTWHLIGTHPQVEARLHEEWDRVLGGRPPAAEDMPRLRYTEMVVCESMRLYPPAYLTGREATRECELGGYRMPTGTNVVFSPWLLHRDPRYFEQPLDFRPERWANGLAGRLPKFAYFPFGGGPRVCIGKAFAMLETVLVLATIGQRWRLTPVQGHPLAPWASFTLRPRWGVQVIVERRSVCRPTGDVVHSAPSARLA